MADKQLSKDAAAAKARHDANREKTKAAKAARAAKRTPKG